MTQMVAVIYRWEVWSAWRRRNATQEAWWTDGTVRNSTPESCPQKVTSLIAAESQEAPESVALVQPDPFDCPLLAMPCLDDHGVIQRANAAAAHLVLDNGIAEGRRLLGCLGNLQRMRARLRQQYVEVCAAHEQGLAMRYRR
ncbi:MAG: hypothetical protein IPK32_25310 [Verrucomicrobiaceae bacterium]|nr:hypothetical protein [Verrucomicrobiaceae bacterium]